MKKMNGKKCIIFLITMLMISSIFALPGNVYAQNVQIPNFKWNYKDEELKINPEIIDVDDISNNPFTNIKQINKQEKWESEVLTEKINEKVEVQDNGVLHLYITIEVTSPTLIKMYKEGFGIPQDLKHVDMEIPEETDRIVIIDLGEGNINEKMVKEPVRERFYQGIVDEQKHLFGFHIINFLSNRIFSENSFNELIIEIEALAVPNIENIEKIGSKNQITLTSAPAENIDYFIDTQIDLINLLLHNLSGIQSFEKIIDLTFYLPENANILNVDNYQKSYSLGDSTLNTNVETISSKEVKYHENWRINEWELIDLEDVIGNLFFIVFEIPSFSLEVLDNFVYNYSILSLNGEHWSWSKDFDLVNFEGNYKGVDVNIDVDLYLSLSGELHGSLEHHKIWTEFGIEAGLEIDAKIEGKLTYTFELWDYMHFSTSCHDWRGTQPVPITITVEPDAEVYVETDGIIEVYINPEANFNLKAGGDLDFKWTYPFVEYHGIFDHSFGGSFDYDFNLEAYAQIKPTLGFEINIGFLSMGLDITPQVYLLGEIGYDSGNNKFYWNAYLGCKLEIGIDVIIKEWEWDLPVDFKVKLWSGSWSPVDNSPPKTKAFIGPGIIDHVGPISYLWFTAKDTGPAASGVDYTMFKVPEADPPYNDWQKFDPTLFYKVTTNIEKFHVQWYSVDKDGNKESQHLGEVNADIIHPSGYLGFDGWYENVGENTFKVKPNTVIYFIAKDDKGKYASYSQVILHFGHNDKWYNSTFSKYPSSESGLYGTTSVIFGPTGEFYVDMYVIDGVWNAAWGQLTFIVDNKAPDKPNKPIGPTYIIPGEVYTYLTKTTDPDGDQISYLFDWGDGDDSGWSTPRDSGMPCSAKHSWDSPGVYFVKAKAKDIYGAESEWSDTLTVDRSRNRVTINTLFLNILVHLTSTFPKLRNLLGG